MIRATTLVINGSASKNKKYLFLPEKIVTLVHTHSNENDVNVYFVL